MLYLPALALSVMASALVADASPLTARFLTSRNANRNHATTKPTWVSIHSRADNGTALPGLDSTQSAHAWDVIGEASAEGLGHQGCLAGITTALVESSIYVYANEGVPESFNYPYDKVGSDYDSVGIFQQRVQYYPDVAADMDPAQSAAQFFKGMTAISGWETMDVGTLCQEVQRSAYPDRYAERVPEAEEICSAGGV